jgi:hypothetical protein
MAARCGSGQLDSLNPDQKLLVAPGDRVDFLTGRRLSGLRVWRPEMRVGHVRLTESWLSRRRGEGIVLPRYPGRFRTLPVGTLLLSRLCGTAESSGHGDVSLRGRHSQPGLRGLRILSGLIGDRLAMNLSVGSLNAGLPWKLA